MVKITLEEYKKKYPEITSAYSDEEFSRLYHEKYHATMPYDEFAFQFMGTPKQEEQEEILPVITPDVSTTKVGQARRETKIEDLEEKPEEGPQDIGTFERTKRALRRGIENYGGTRESIREIGFGDDEKIQERAEELKLREFDQQQRLGTQTSFRDVTEAWSRENSEEYARGFGQTLLDYTAETAASSAPQMAVGITAGLTAAGAAAFIPLPGARLAAFALGYSLSALPYFFGQNLERQVEEGRLTEEEINTTGALGSAALQSATDTFLFMLTGGGGKVLKDTAQKTALEAIIQGASRVGKGVGVGAGIEGVTETLQTAVERFQAGLPLRPEDEQAVWEYMESFAGGVAVGGPIGGVNTAAGDYLASRGRSKKEITEEQGKAEKEAYDINIVEESFSPQIVIDDKEVTGQEKGPVTNKRAPGFIENFIPMTPDKTIFDSEKGANRKIEFEDIPANSKLRLPFYKLEEKVDEDGERSIDFIPLRDPETKKLVTKDYMIEEFFDPETQKPDIQKLQQVEVTYNDEIYKPQWKDPEGSTNVLSTAYVNMDINNPLNAVDTKLTRDFTSKDVLNVLRGEENLDFKNVPKGATEEDIINNVNAKRKLRFLLGKGRRFFKADRGLDSELYNTILGNRYLNRGIQKRVQDLATRIDEGLKTLSSTKDFIYRGISQKGYGDFSTQLNIAVEKYISGKVAPQEAKALLKELGLDNKTINLIGDLRSLVDTQSKDILNVMNELDPDQKRWGEPLREAIKDRIGSYLTVAYGLNVDPTYVPPDRLKGKGIRFTDPFTKKERTILGPTKLERQQHEEAVRAVADLYEKSGTLGVRTRGQAEILARENLNKLYNKKISVNELQEGFVESEQQAEKEADLDKADIVLDRGILKKVGKLPEEIKNVLGEIKNPISRAAYTAVKQAELISNIKTMDTLFNIANDPQARQVSPVAFGVFDTQIELKDDPLNPFNGQYTTKEFAQALAEVTGNYMYSGFDKFTGSPVYVMSILKPKNLVQRFKLIYSPSTQLRNIESAIGFILANGNLDVKTPREFMRVLKTAASDFRKMTTGDTERLSGLGILNTGVFAGEIAAQAELAGVGDTPLSYVARIDKELHPNKKNMFQKVGKIWRDKIANPLTKSYQFGDDLWKVYGFRAEYNTFSKAFDLKRPKDDDFDYTTNSKNAKQKEWEQSKEYSDRVEDNIKIIRDLMYGEKFVQGLTADTPKGRLNQAVEELAAYRVRNNMPNYDFVAPLTETLRKMPVGNFTSFPTEQTRTTYNIIASAGLEKRIGDFTKAEANGLQDVLENASNTLTNPLETQRKIQYLNKIGSSLQKRGYKRAFGISGYMATFQFVTPLSTALKLGIGLSAAGAIARAFLPEWEQRDNILIYGYDKETGEIYYINTSNSDAYDVVAAPFRTTFKGMADGFTEQDPEIVVDSTVNAIMDYLDPYISLSIANELQLELLLNRQFDSGRQIYNDQDKLHQKLTKLTNYAFKKAGPGIVPQAQRLSDSLLQTLEEDKFNKFGRKQDEVEAVARISGLTMNTKNVLKDFATFGLTEFEQNKNNAIRDFRVSQYAQGRDLKDTNRIVDSYRDAVEKYYELVNDTRKIINVGGEVYIKPIQFLETINKQGRTMDKIDKANLFQLEEGSKFVPLRPKNWYDKSKALFIENSLSNVLQGEALEEAKARLNAVPFPEEQLLEIYEEFAEKNLFDYETKEDPFPDQTRVILFGQDITEEDTRIRKRPNRKQTRDKS